MTVHSLRAPLLLRHDSSIFFELCCLCSHATATLLTGCVGLVAVSVLWARMSVPVPDLVEFPYLITTESVREQLVQNEYTKTSVLVQYWKLVSDFLPFFGQAVEIEVLSIKSPSLQYTSYAIARTAVHRECL